MPKLGCVICPRTTPLPLTHHILTDRGAEIAQEKRIQRSTSTHSTSLHSTFTTVSDVMNVYSPFSQHLLVTHLGHVTKHCKIIFYLEKKDVFPFISITLIQRKRFINDASFNMYLNLDFKKVHKDPCLFRFVVGHLFAKYNL